MNLFARIWEVLTRRIDSMLFGCALAIVGVGIVTLFSASDQSIPRMTNQVASFAFAIASTRRCSIRPGWTWSAAN